MNRKLIFINQKSLRVVAEGISAAYVNGAPPDNSDDIGTNDKCDFDPLCGLGIPDHDNSG